MAFFRRGVRWAGRLRATGLTKVIIGISGGLDSTQALLVCAQAFDLLGLPRDGILAYTMPGFATSGHTKSSNAALMRPLGVTASTRYQTSGEGGNTLAPRETSEFPRAMATRPSFKATDNQQGQNERPGDQTDRGCMLVLCPVAETKRAILLFIAVSVRLPAARPRWRILKESRTVPDRVCRAPRACTGRGSRAQARGRAHYDIGVHSNRP
jgi:hypothetical protein